MHSKSIILALFLFLSSMIYSQEKCTKSLEESLSQIADILHTDNGSLWGRKLNADIIFINVADNEMYFTNLNNGKVGAIEVEAWDQKIGLANTATMYNGKKYVTIIYTSFTENSCIERASILIHEIFHYHQDQLGFPGATSDNQHLDTPVGRALLHSEFDALTKAIEGDEQSLFEALYIRSYRESLFPENNEVKFELHEGLAEYTGIKLAISDIPTYLLKQIKFNPNQGYTNSFAYKTGPMYAYFLDLTYPSWRKSEELHKGLPYMLALTKSELNITLDKAQTNLILEKYGYKEYLQVEESSFLDTTQYEALLNADAERLFIPNRGINIFFNTNDRIISLNGEAVLLKNVKLKARWGELTVDSGLVRMNDWSAFIVLPPTETTENEIKGNDYDLKLSDGWLLKKTDNAWEIIEKE